MRNHFFQTVVFLCLILITISCEKEEINTIESTSDTIESTSEVSSIVSKSKAIQTYNVTYKLLHPSGDYYISPAYCLEPSALRYIGNVKDKYYDSPRSCSTLKNLPAEGLYNFFIDGILPDGMYVVPRFNVDINELPTSSSGHSGYKILELKTVMY